MEATPQAVAEPIDETPQQDSVTENIARYLKEHETPSATHRNMHIHEPEEPSRED